MGFVGGLRARLIRDSLSETVKEGLDSLGWFDSGRSHQPLHFLREPANWDEPINLNSLSISATDVIGDDAEMGSQLSIETWDFFVDFYAENDPVGLHVIHDIRDILRGKIPSIGRGRPVLDVMNWTLATPTPAFTCEIEDVVVDRATGFNRPWLFHWYTCRASILDTYANEAD